MPENIRNKRNFIISLLYIGCLVALFYLFFKYAFGLLSPFIIAILVAILLQRPVNFISRKTPIKRSIISVVFVLLAVAAIALVLGLVVSKLVTELRELVNYLIAQLKKGDVFIAQVTDWISGKLGFLPDSVVKSLNDKITELMQAVVSVTVSDAARTAAGSAGGSVFSNLFAGSGITFSSIMSSGSVSSLVSVVKQVPTVAVSILVAVICCIFMTSDYKTLRGLILGVAGHHSRTLVKTKQVVFSTLGKYIKSYSIIILITFSELFIGLYFLKLIKVYNGGYIAVIALIAAIIDIIPVLGTGTVLIPWALYQLFISGNVGMGVGLIVMYIIITVLRQIIEPKLVGNELGLPAFITLMAMYLGSQLFGFIGLFLLPLTLAVLMSLNEEGIIHIMPVKTLEPEEPEQTFMLKVIDKAKNKKEKKKKK